ncbi:MAG TPA: alpha/beta hydrolase [Patescibacteria group bacterium]|jgi:acetyl esterase/lipase|nr:alpha/beta hydrolase [Patescibacteria group bacterium]
MSYEFKVEDVEYVRHGDTPQLARLYRPQGSGPFPIMVELHGGAWCRQDRLADKLIHESLAKSGVIVASLDFRQPPAAPYPASFQDIHYGIRWLKSRAAELGSRPDMIGSMGNSSGGHQAMLLAMRAFDPRYGALPQPAGSTFDATVRAVIMCSPVIDPIGRYRYAKDIEAKGKPYPLAVDELIPCHDKYWQTEAAMDEGSPATALEKGERVQLPPVLYLQGTEDLAHPRPHLDRFVGAYRKAGGVVDLELFDGEGQGFIMRKAGSPASDRALDLISEFTLKHLR